jgi:serine/threonine protein kinase
MRKVPDGERGGANGAERDRGEGTHDPSALPGGSQIGAFMVEAVLGSGGFGITYLVRHETLNKQFALKEYFPRQFSYRQDSRVHPTATGRTEYAWGLDRFAKEAQALARFKHPAIVDVSDIFQANNTAYMVLAYERAPSLEDWLARLRRPPTQDELDGIVVPLLEALELVHGQGMLHRDVAPDNILVRADGSPVLIDFGAARGDLKDRAAPVTALVKPGYSPPEQYQGAAATQGPWSDVYGFGATLYFAVVGALPVEVLDRFDARRKTETAQRARGAYRRPFLQAIDWAMQYEPAARPQTVAQWRAALLCKEPPRATPWGQAASVPESRATTARRMFAAVLPSGIRAARRPSLRVAITGGAAIIAAGCILLALLFAARCTLFASVFASTCGSGPPRPTAIVPLQLEIALPKASYAIGDNLTFGVKSNRDCYFLVYTVSPTGEVERHYPSENGLFMGGTVLKAGEWRQLPVQGFATVKAPTGNFELGAICSKEPLESLGLSDAQLRESARSGTRSFKFAIDNVAKAAGRTDFARASVGYEVHQ